MVESAETRSAAVLESAETRRARLCRASSGASPLHYFGSGGFCGSLVGAGAGAGAGAGGGADAAGGAEAEGVAEVTCFFTASGETC